MVSVGFPSGWWLGKNSCQTHSCGFLFKVSWLYFCTIWVAWMSKNWMPKISFASERKALHGGSLVTRWNSWILCARALCGAARRCLSLSRRHCPGSYTAEASRSRWSGQTATREPSQGTWAGRGATGAPSHSMTCWIDPWSWVEARRRGYTETGTEPWPAGGPRRAGAAAATRRASPPWPNGCHWRGRSRGCRPWPPPLPPPKGTEAGRGVWAGGFPGPGTRWWSSCASSTWRVCSGTRPASRGAMS